MLPTRTAIVNVLSNGWAQVRLCEEGHEWPWVTLENEAAAIRECINDLKLPYTVVRQPSIQEIERANIRAQIRADQAQRAEGEVHTARTVAIAAGRVPAEWTRLSAAQQRQIFGGAWAGRREVRHNVRRGVVEVYQKVDYGRDYNIQDWSYAEIAQLLNRRETVVGKKD